MKILLIDDSSTFLRLMNSILTDEGYDVKGVSTIQKAEDLMVNSLPDLIILDLFLTNDHGFRFLEEIKLNTERKHIPVIVVSSTNKPDVIKKAMKIGAADYIIKPLNIQDIKNKCSLFLKLTSSKS